MLRKTIANTRVNERGGTLLEFAFVATGFFMMLVAIVAAGNLYFTHNALVEATRRGARYAVMNRTGSDTAVQNVVVYGTDSPGVGAKSLIYNLQPSNVTVTYSSLNIASGSVTVSITNYTFPFVLPITTTSISMPSYRTTLTGESAGLVPGNL